MMFSTIPLLSLYREQGKCLSCRCRHSVNPYVPEGDYKGDEIYYDEVILNKIDNKGVYDYRCPNCCDNREYDKSYNRLHKRSDDL